MQKIWNEFDSITNSLMEKCKGKKIALWGYGMNGWFAEHLLKKCGRSIDYVIDKTGKTYRPYYIRYLDSATTCIIVSFTPTSENVEYLESVGFVESVNFIELKKLFLGDQVNGILSYERWLETKYDLDITNASKKTNMINADSHVYGTGLDYAVMEVIEEMELSAEDAVFDIGCGKGGALSLFLKKGIEKIGGIEYDKELYDVLMDNYMKLGIKSTEFICGDARQLTKELDKYNIIFMYDPFDGDMFKDVMINIENSYQRKKRKMKLIYESPSCHEEVIGRGVFNLTRHISIPYLTYPDINIYEIS